MSLTGCQATNRLLTTALEDTGVLKRVSSCPTKSKRDTDTGYGVHTDTEYTDTDYRGNTDTGYSENIDTGYYGNTDTGYYGNTDTGYSRNTHPFRGASIERHDAIDISDDEELVTDDTVTKLVVQP